MIMFETNRLTIRHIKERDKPTFLSFHNEKETMRYVSSGKSDWSMDELNQKLRYNDTLYPIGFGIYCIELKQRNEVIGEASIFNSFNDIKTPEIGYIIAKQFQNQGFGTEIINGLIRYCSNSLHATRIVARMYSENIYSARLCEKIGMQLYESITLDCKKQRLSYELIVPK